MLPLAGQKGGWRMGEEKMCWSVVLWLITASGCAQVNTDATSQAIELFPGCNPEWLEEVPPNPAWGLPPTFGDLVQHPLDFRDFDVDVIWFLAPTAGLNDVLPPGVAPTVLVPNSPLGPLGLAVISFWNYKDVEYFDSYRESIVSVQVQDESADRGYQPLFVVNIALDSEAAQWAGNVTGFGKILGNTHCHDVPSKGTKCMSESDDKLIMKATIDTNHPDLGTFDLAPTMTLTIRDGLLVHTPVSYTGGVLFGTSASPNFKFGEYPFAQRLAAAGIGAIPSTLSFWGHDMSSLIGQGIGGEFPYCTPL